MDFAQHDSTDLLRSGERKWPALPLQGQKTGKSWEWSVCVPF